MKNFTLTNYFQNGTILFVLLLAKIGLVVYIIVVFSNNLNEIKQTFHDIFEMLYQSYNPIIKILVQRIKEEVKSVLLF